MMKTPTDAEKREIWAFANEWFSHINDFAFCHIVWRSSRTSDPMTGLIGMVYFQSGGQFCSTLKDLCAPLEYVRHDKAIQTPLAKRLSEMCEEMDRKKAPRRKADNMTAEARDAIIVHTEITISMLERFIALFKTFACSSYDQQCAAKKHKAAIKLVELLRFQAKCVNEAV